MSENLRFRLDDWKLRTYSEHLQHSVCHETKSDKEMKHGY